MSQFTGVRTVHLQEVSRIHRKMLLKDVLGVRVTCGTTEAQGFNPRIESRVPILLIHLRTWASQFAALVLIHSPVKWKDQMLYSPVSVELSLVKKRINFAKLYTLCMQVVIVTTLCRAEGKLTVTPKNVH